jgi:hypothetical protein
MAREAIPSSEEGHTGIQVASSTEQGPQNPAEAVLDFFRIRPEIL